MKISLHPRMQNVNIGDEVYSCTNQIFARVDEVFPAAVCVRVGVLAHEPGFELIWTPQLWRADEIENLSVCRYCASRENLLKEHGTGIPFRICAECAAERQTTHSHYPPRSDHQAPGANRQ